MPEPEDARDRTLQAAIKLLAAKPRSIAELREKLLARRGVTENDVDSTIEKLKGYGYLDDERFAFGFAAYRVRQKPLGRRRLERDLYLKKVPRETADVALDLVFAETSEASLIDRAIEKRLRVRGRPESPADVKKLTAHLLRLGFPYELIISKVRDVVERGDEL
jgi:regulatory protein